jgi:hypothetical protein
MRLTFRRTQRGFTRAEFFDRYGEKCSIQASSLATERAIWLGTDAPIIMLNDHKHPNAEAAGLSTLGGRMHLTRKHAARLALILAAFAQTGELPEPSARGPVLDGMPDEEPRRNPLLDALDEAVTALYLYGPGDKHHRLACRAIVRALRPDVDVDEDQELRALYRELNPELEGS